MYSLIAEIERCNYDIFWSSIKLLWEVKLTWWGRMCLDRSAHVDDYKAHGPRLHPNSILVKLREFVGTVVNIQKVCLHYTRVFQYLLQKAWSRTSYYNLLILIYVEVYLFLHHPWRFKTAPLGEIKNQKGLPISRHVNFHFGNSSKNPDELLSLLDE